MKRRPLVFLIFGLVFTFGCDYFFTHVATQIRHALLEGNARLKISEDETVTFTLQPDH